jgi:hypothetical protein
MRDLVPFVSHGILTAGTSGMISISTDGTIWGSLDEKTLTKWAKSTASEEISEIIRKAAFVGKWLATAGSSATVFTAMGVRLENYNS